MAADKNTLDGLRIDRDAESRSGIGRWVWIPLLLLVAVAAFAGWRWLSGPRALPVRTAVAEQGAKGAAGTVLNASGYVTARRQATVSSKVTGKVVEVLVEEGMAVAEGQILARLDDAIARKQVALAEAELTASRRGLDENAVRLRQAKLEHGRQQKLAGQGVTAQSDLDSAAAESDSLAARLALGHQQVEVAGRQLALARQDLEDTVIRAPFAGVAISKDAQPGEMISPVSAGGGFTRTGICTLVDMASLEIDVDVNESTINRVSAGQKAQATLDAYPDWQIPATVIAVIPAADRQKATVRVRLGFDQRDPRILPDMGIKVAFLSPEAADAAKAGGAPARPDVLIPRTAVRKDGGHDVVFVVHEDQAERRAVTLGAADGDRVAVVSGLAAGETVINPPPPELAAGARIQVLADAEGKN